jgi:hypothetical protein
MSQDSLERLPKFTRRLSQAMAVFCLITIVLSPVGILLYWMVTDVGDIALSANLAPSAIQGTLSIWQRVVAGVISGVPLALMLVGLWQAYRFFKLFAAGQIFSTRAARYLSRFAGWLLASVLGSVLSGAAVTVVITLQNMEGSRLLAVSISSDQIFLMFFAAMVYLMASVIRQGQKLAEENATFV